MNIDIKTADGEGIELGGAYYDGHGTECRAVGIMLIDYRHITDVSLSCLTGKAENLCCVSMRPDELYSSKPDSWEKLEEDLQRIDLGESGWFCMYAGYGKDNDKCYSECKFFKNKTPCAKQASRDIVSRIRKLRGED